MEVFNDPIFKVSVPQAALAPITQVLNEQKGGEEIVSGSGSGDYDYDYGFDYADYEMEDIGRDVNRIFGTHFNPIQRWLRNLCSGK